MPYKVVREFEEAIAAYAGSRFAVAVESGTAALFLACHYDQVKCVTIPARTYPSVPCSIIHAGGHVHFSPEPWQGIYQLKPYNIWDGALRFRRGMYAGGLHCLSFHARKHLRIGRGGMVLTDSEAAYRWLKLARFDGREEMDLNAQGTFHVLGWNMYMTPEEAARGLLLFASQKRQELPDLDVAQQGYPDLSRSAIYQQGVPNEVCS